MNKTNYLLLAMALAVCGLECSAQTVSGQIEGHDYVDLGLPSGRLWATCNVGANIPTEYGGYFAWGETAQKVDYSQNQYQWSAAGESNKFSKYCTDNSFGNVDNKKELESADDAAAVVWGHRWRTPSVDEQREMIDGCYWKWVPDYNGSGVTFRVGTSKRNGNTIFLPVAGNREEKGLYMVGFYGYYWSASLNEYDSQGAYSLDFNEDYIDWGYGQRCVGRSVRAVAK